MIKQKIHLIAAAWPNLIPLLFTVHRHAQAAGVRSARAARLGKRLRLVDPLGYIEFMNLVSGARVVITDSGGVQEETTYLGIPCFTLRENTERPITVSEGSNRLVRPEQLVGAVQEAAKLTGRLGRSPELWDGHAAQRAVASLQRRSGG